MSFPCTATTGLRKTGLSVDVSTWAGVTVGAWIKPATAGYCRVACFQGDADAARPAVLNGCDAGLYPSLSAVQAGGTNELVYHTASPGTAAAWNLMMGWWKQNGDIAAAVGAAFTGMSSAVTGLDTAPLKTIGVGVQINQGDGVTNEFGTVNYKLAIPFIAMRPPTTGTGSELEALAAGAHPLAVFGANLYDYWPPDSKTSALHGLVLADVGGSITIDTGDNPTVDAPPAGGGGGGVTLVHVERGRTICRGLGRGIA